MKTNVQNPKISVLAVVSILCVLVSGAKCSDNSGTDRTSEGAQRAELSEVVAAAHRIPAQRPDRIVSLAPNVTEILYELGLESRIVAVSKHSDYPSDVSSKPSIGSGLNPNLEAILSHDPDLTVGVETQNTAQAAKQLRDADIPFVFLKMDSIDQTIRAISAMGEIAHIADRAKKLATEIRTTLQQKQKRYDTTEKKVMMVYGHSPIIVAGPGTFGDELIELAGAKNAFSDSSKSLPKLGVEQLIARDPDVIIDTSGINTQRDLDEFWNQFSELTAVKNNRVYLLEDASLLRAGPRLPKALEAIHRSISKGGS